jgi:hypothetical protein
MTDVEVRCEPVSGGWRCRAEVTARGRRAEFDVMARDPAPYLPTDTTAPTDEDVERLVRETFAFLLEREPLGSILSSFDLKVVERYFPEYRAEIRRRLSDEG